MTIGKKGPRAMATLTLALQQPLVISTALHRPSFCPCWDHEQIVSVSLSREDAMNLHTKVSLGDLAVALEQAALLS